MKKIFCFLAFFLLWFSQTAFASDLVVQISEVNPKTEEKLEEFDFPEEKNEVKNVIKADIGAPVSAFLFEFYNLLQTDIIRVPLSWEIAFSNYATFQLEIDSLSYIFIPAAAGVSGGFSIYPLGKAPSGLFISLRAGGAFGVFYALTAQAQLGWQFILKDNFVISTGADFSFYYMMDSAHFYIPSVNLAFGWAF